MPTNDAIPGGTAPKRGDVRRDEDRNRRSRVTAVRGLLGALCVTVALVAVAVSVGPAAATATGGERTAATAAQGDFGVTIDSTNSPVVEGQTLTVNATVSNGVLAESGTQNVTLSVDGAVRDETNVTLDSGESKTVTLAWETGSGDAGEYTATVATENDSDSTSVTVRPPGALAANITDTTSPVTAGKTLEVNATIENVGYSSTTQQVTLSVGGEIRDSTEVTVGPRNSTNVTFSWATTSDDTGEYTASVTTQDDAAFQDVTVGPPPDLDVTVTETTSPVTEGETLEVVALVVNTGNISSTQDVTLSAADVQRDATNVTLDPGNRTSVVLSWATASGDAGEYTATVASATDNDTASVTVNAPPEAAIASEPSSPSTGQAVTFEADASDPDGTVESYEWAVDGEVVSTSPTVQYTFESGGEHEVTLAVTDNDGASGTASATVTVSDENLQPSASFSHAPDAPAAGETVTFAAEASDPDGSVASYEWSVDGSTVGSGPELRHTFESGGDHEVTLTVTDDGGASTIASATVVVNAPPEASISPSPTGPTVDEQVAFAAEASDPDGNVTSYEWSVDGSTAGSGPELRHTFESAGDHEVTLTVTDDEGASSTVSRTVSVQSLATPTPTPTATPTETPTLPIPGFTAGAAVIGVVVALVARRLLQ